MRGTSVLLFLTLSSCALFSAKPADAAIVTSATCGGYFGSSNGDTRCSATGVPDLYMFGATGGWATISAGVSMPATASDYLIATIASTIYAACGGGSGPQLCPPAQSSTSARIDLELTTSGAMRPGFIEIMRPFDQWSSADGAEYVDWSAYIGSLGGACSLGDSSYENCIGIGDDSYVRHFNSMLPFVLGVPFTFDESFTATAYSSEDLGLSAGGVDEVIGFRLMDADGTPVEIEAVPEPATLALVVLPALTIICIRRKSLSIRNSAVLKVLYLTCFASAMRADDVPVTFIWNQGMLATTPYYGGPFQPATLNSMNDSGTVVGALVSANSYRIAGTWNGTDLNSFAMLPGYLQSFANGINNAGWAVGLSLPANEQSEPTEWKDGRAIDLGLSAGFTSGQAESINDAGYIVGVQINAQSQVATLWVNGLPTILARPSLGNEATAINDAGQIVGQVSGFPTIWQDGMMSELPCSSGGAAYSINDTGQAVGHCGSNAVIWQNGTMTVIGPDLALGINDRGTVVGRTSDNPLMSQTYIWTPQAGASILPGFLWSEPFAINDTGSIVGFGELAPVSGVPEPSSASLVLFAVLLLSTGMRLLTRRRGQYR